MTLNNWNLSLGLKWNRVDTDPDAEAFISAASISDQTQIDAINTLVDELKSNNLWDKMHAIYPFVGGNATSHSYNLKDTSTYQITWINAVTHASTGVTGAASSYGKTGYTPSVDATLNDSHISTSFRVDTINGAMGSLASGNFFGQIYNTAAAVYASYMYTSDVGDGGAVSEPIGDGIGYGVASRQSNILYKNFSDGVENGSNTTAHSGTLVGVELAILGLNVGVVAIFTSTNETDFATIGLGLTDAECTTLSTIVSDYQTNLGR